MSAFIVNRTHLDYLITAGLKTGNYGPLRWFAPAEDAIPASETHQRGEPWGPRAIEAANARRRELTRATADRTGAMLAAENRRSVDHRYDENEIEDFYVYRPYAGPITPAQTFKALDCYAYQSCEHPEWETSEAHDFCEALRKATIHQLPGYEAAAWEIPETPTAPAPAVPVPPPAPTPAPAPAPKTYRTPAEDAAEVRAALKRKGWTSRQISVRTDTYSMGASIDVTIKDPRVPFEPVKAIAKRAESIDYDERTGEILSGGNQYVRVCYSWEVFKIFAETYTPAVQAAADEQARLGGSFHGTIPGTPFTLGRTAMGGFSLWDDSHLGEFDTVEGVAERVGALMAGRQAS